VVQLVGDSHDTADVAARWVQTQVWPALRYFDAIAPAHMPTGCLIATSRTAKRAPLSAATH
jgi:hypothetical protein